MTREEAVARIAEVGIIPGIRVASAELALFAAESVHGAGIPVAEITMTVPGAIEVIAKLASRFPGLVVGGGTVLDAETAKRCVDAGARFLTSPGFVPEVMDVALQGGVVAMPGALTPTEVIAAWKGGADFVKIFPCAPMGGEKYIRTLRVPMPQIPLIASGGVNQMTAAGFIHAGATAVGIGSELIPREALKLRKDKWVYELARRFKTIIQEARRQMAAG